MKKTQALNSVKELPKSEVPPYYLRAADNDELAAAILWAKDWKRAAAELDERYKVQLANNKKN